MPGPLDQRLIDVVSDCKAHGVAITAIKEELRFDRQYLVRIEQKIDGLKTWMMGILATALIACALLIAKTVLHDANSATVPRLPASIHLSEQLSRP
jgi:hypothetical protein